MARQRRTTTSIGGSGLVITNVFRRSAPTLAAAVQRVVLVLVLVTVPGVVGAQNGDLEMESLSTLDGPLVTTTAGADAEIRVRLVETASADIRVFFPEFPEGISSPGNPTLLTRGGGAVEVRIELTADRPGRYIIDGILIGSTNGLRAIEPVLFEVSSTPGGAVPVRARWRVLSEEFFQSQSIPVILEMVGADEYLFPDEISYRAPQTGLFEEVGGIGEVATRAVGGVEIFDIPVAAFLFTPATPGDVRLPEASIRSGDVVATAPARALNVLPIPASAGVTNAVGVFEIDSRLNPTEIDRDENATVALEIEISGTGNLPVIAFPEIDAPAFEEIDRTERVTAEPDRTGRNGYTGERLQTVRFEFVGNQNPADDTTAITVGGYTFFDPNTSRTVRIPPRRHEITLRGGATTAESDRAIPAFPLLTLGELTAVSWYRLAEVPWVLYFFLLGPVIMGVSALWSVRRGPPSRRGPPGRRRSTVGAVITIVPFLLGVTIAPALNSERIRTATRLVDEGRPAVAGVMYDLEIADNPWHAGLHYNRGVLSLQMERPVVATYHLRRAVRLAPQQRQFREALAAASEYFGLDEQIPIPRYPRPDYLILIIIILWTAFWIVLSAGRRLRNTLSLVGIGMLIVFAIGTFFWSWNLDRREEGVVRRPVHVRRIPDESAVPWIGLTTAQAVGIELRYEEFFLVRTRSGMTGWVPRSAVWTDNDG